MAMVESISYESIMQSSMETLVSEVSPSRQVDPNNFASSAYQFQWSISAPRCFVPAKVYLRVDLEIRGPAADTLPSLADGLAISEYGVGSLFNSFMLSLNGTMLDQITMGTPMAYAIQERMKPHSYQQTLGKLFGPTGAFAERSAAISYATLEGPDMDVSTMTPVYSPTLTLSVASAGAPAFSVLTLGGDASIILNPGDVVYIKVGGTSHVFNIMLKTDATHYVVNSLTAAIPANTVTSHVIYTTNTLTSSRLRFNVAKNTLSLLVSIPLGVMQLEDAILRAGSYALTVTPSAWYKQAMMQGVRKLTVGIDYDVLVRDMRLFVPTFKTEYVGNPTTSITYYPILCQSKPIASGNGTYNFVIGTGTKVLYVWFQSGNNLQDMTLPQTRFVLENNAELKLTSIRCTYDGVTKPGQPFNLLYTEHTNYLSQLYHNYLAEVGHESGTESFEQWLDRGMIIIFRFDRTSSSKTTDMTLNIAITDVPANSHVWVAAKTCIRKDIVVENGAVVAIKEAEV